MLSFGVVCTTGSLYICRSSTPSPLPSSKAQKLQKSQGKIGFKKTLDSFNSPASGSVGKKVRKCLLVIVDCFLLNIRHVQFTLELIPTLFHTLFSIDLYFPIGGLLDIVLFTTYKPPFTRNRPVSYSHLPLITMTIDPFLQHEHSLKNVHKFQSGYEQFTTLCILEDSNLASIYEYSTSRRGSCCKNESIVIVISGNWEYETGLFFN